MKTIWAIWVLMLLIIIFFQVSRIEHSTSAETLIRENERCLYENARLEDANTRLLEELSETVEDWTKEEE